MGTDVKRGVGCLTCGRTTPVEYRCRLAGPIVRRPANIDRRCCHCHEQRNEGCMLLITIGLLDRGDDRPALNAKCEDRMAATDALATVDMQSIYSVPVVHLGGVVRMHLGEGQAVDTEVMVMRMQRCPYLIDHQQQHQDQSHQQCECAHDSVRWRSVHLGCREWRLLDFIVTYQLSSSLATASRSSGTPGRQGRGG